MKRVEFLKGALAVAGTLGAAAMGAQPAAASSRPVRPPGAASEDRFLSLCIRCMRCADACPNQAIQAFTEDSGRRFSMAPGRGEAGTPVVFARLQACTLCATDGGDVLRCGEACPSGALKLVRKTPEDIQANVRMGTARVDENLCYSFTTATCGVCIRACPFQGKAIRAGSHERPIVDPAFCVGCGLCERVCVRFPQAMSILAPEALA